jgi:hypothetical protein
MGNFSAAFFSQRFFVWLSGVASLRPASLQFLTR